MSQANIGISRRAFHFLAGAALTTVWSRHVFAARPVPSDRIQVGIIGLGSRGFNLLDQLIALPDIDIPIVCDVDRLHYRDQTWGKGKRFGRDAAVEHIRKTGRPAPQSCSDFREVCRRSDLDAVVIATPDHWHALCTLESILAGKDVYCEKPLTHNFREGIEVCQAVEKHKTVFQTGSQQRSSAEFRRAVELVRNGVPGNIQRIEVGLPAGYELAQDDTQVAPWPKDLDYDAWCGPSPLLPYMRARHHRWWRGHRAFGGGTLMDWIGHHNDIAHWAMDLDRGGPFRVEALHWQPSKALVYDTPWHFEIACTYPSGVTSRISTSNSLGTKFIGDDGWLHVTRGKLTCSEPEWERADFDAGSFHLPPATGHMQNFIDCVRSRKPCVAPAEAGHRSITPGHLAFVSHALQRPLTWDAASQQVSEDRPANELLHRLEYRDPWSLTGQRHFR